MRLRYLREKNAGQRTPSPVQRLDVDALRRRGGKTPAAKVSIFPESILRWSSKTFRQISLAYLPKESDLRLAPGEIVPSFVLNYDTIILTNIGETLGADLY